MLCRWPLPIHFGPGRSIENVKFIAANLIENFQAVWKKDTALRTTEDENPVRIRYGIQGEQARALSEGPEFR